MRNDGASVGRHSLAVIRIDGAIGKRSRARLLRRTFDSGETLHGGNVPAVKWPRFHRDEATDMNCSHSRIPAMPVRWTFLLREWP